MCTGGGSLLKGRWRGSTTLTPSIGKNHNFPSEVLATCGLKCPLSGRLLTPSELSNTVAWMVRLVSLFWSTAALQASSSARATHTSPHAVYSQKECSSSSIAQFTVSQGNPFLLVSVAMLPFFSRLSPLSVEIQSAPSRPN